MRHELVLTAAIALTACGGHTGSSAAPAPPALPALRWVPDHPTYVLASATLGDAQHSLRDATEVLGAIAGYDLGDVVAALTGLLGVDPLHPDPLAGIGVDLRGSWAAYSDAFEPTFVIHLAAPDLMTAFLERQRGRGLVTHSVVVDQLEVSTATLIGGVTLSWAIAGDWMWIHAAHGGGGDTGWLTRSRAPHPASFAPDWAWAQATAGARARVVGWFDLHGLVPRVLAGGERAVQCAARFAPVRRAALALEADDHAFDASLVIDVGDTDAIRRAVVAPPAGWAPAAAKAALAGQWNLDLAAIHGWLAPCLALVGHAPPVPGVRTARGFVSDLDPDQLAGAGAVMLDLTDPAFFARQLDRIPLRSSIERKRAFAGHPGATVEIPFGPTIEYALDGQVFAAALGAGLLERALAPGPATAPLAALDVAPPAMSAKAWAALLHLIATQDLASSPGARTQRMVERLMRWREGHVSLTTTQHELVLAISGTRR